MLFNPSQEFLEDSQMYYHLMKLHEADSDSPKLPPLLEKYAKRFLSCYMHLCSDPDMARNSIRQVASLVYMMYLENRMGHDQ